MTYAFKYGEISFSPSLPSPFQLLRFGYLSLGAGFCALGWDLCFKAALKALRIGFGPRCWGSGLGAVIWASRLKFFILENENHWSFWSRCPKSKEHEQHSVEPEIMDVKVGKSKRFGPLETEQKKLCRNFEPRFNMSPSDNKSKMLLW